MEGKPDSVPLRLRTCYGLRRRFPKTLFLLARGEQARFERIHRARVRLTGGAEWVAFEADDLETGGGFQVLGLGVSSAADLERFRDLRDECAKRPATRLLVEVEYWGGEREIFVLMSEFERRQFEERRPPRSGEPGSGPRGESA
jgi:hypothetical protein